ncbi:hypothetical protein HDU79_006934 [Rhizoclosmatium sp. JEL0117]|nr:hypothetical protein HDU79_006934 [Rhizoclosmatium sp. JEL0117]
MNEDEEDEEEALDNTTKFSRVSESPWPPPSLRSSSSTATSSATSPSRKHPDFQNFELGSSSSLPTRRRVSASAAVRAIPSNPQIRHGRFHSDGSDRTRYTSQVPPVGPYTAAYFSGTKPRNDLLRQPFPRPFNATHLPLDQSSSSASRSSVNSISGQLPTQRDRLANVQESDDTIAQQPTSHASQQQQPVTTISTNERPKLPSLGAMIDAHAARMMALQQPTPTNATATPKSASATTPYFPMHQGGRSAVPLLQPYQQQPIPIPMQMQIPMQRQQQQLFTFPRYSSSQYKTHRRTVSTPQNFGRTNTTTTTTTTASGITRPMHQHSLSTSAALPSPATISSLAAVMTGLAGSPSLYKPKFKYSDAQKQILQREFDVNQYPNHEKKEELGRLTGTTSTQVQFWFQNMRQKLSKRDGGSSNGGGGGGGGGSGGGGGTRPSSGWTTEYNNGDVHGKRKRE